jgi:uncharacterized protein (DUF3084 family)
MPRSKEVDEAMFQIMRIYAEAEDEAKIWIFEQKFKRDSDEIQSTHYRIKDLTKAIEDHKDDKKHVARLTNQLENVRTRWQALVTERRKNETAFGPLFTSLYGKCATHLDNMWFTWNEPDSNRQCIECERQEMERYWELEKEKEKELQKDSCRSED